MHTLTKNAHFVPIWELEVHTWQPGYTYSHVSGKLVRPCCPTTLSIGHAPSTSQTGGFSKAASPQRLCAFSSACRKSLPLVWSGWLCAPRAPASAPRHTSMPTHVNLHTHCHAHTHMHARSHTYTHTSSPHENPRPPAHPLRSCKRSPSPEEDPPPTRAPLILSRASSIAATPSRAQPAVRPAAAMKRTGIREAQPVRTWSRRRQATRCAEAAQAGTASGQRGRRPQGCARWEAAAAAAVAAAASIA